MCDTPESLNRWACRQPNRALLPEFQPPRVNSIPHNGRRRPHLDGCSRTNSGALRDRRCSASVWAAQAVVYDNSEDRDDFTRSQQHRRSHRGAALKLSAFYEPIWSG